MMYDPDNHAAFRESIAAALAGGLGASEQAAFEAHRAACPDCAAEFERARASEAAIAALLAPAQPIGGFEDRVIQRLRQDAGSRRRFHIARPNWRLHPALGKAVAGVAAAIVLGGVGYAVSGVLQEQTRVKSASNLRQIGQAVLTYSNDNRDYFSYSYQNPFPGTRGVGAGFKLNNSLGTGFAVAGDALKTDYDGDDKRVQSDDGHAPRETNRFWPPPATLGRAATPPAITEGVRGGLEKSSDASRRGGAVTGAAGEGRPVDTKEGVSLNFQTQLPASAGGYGWFKPTELAKGVDAEKSTAGRAYDANDSVVVADLPGMTTQSRDESVPAPPAPAVAPVAPAPAPPAPSSGDAAGKPIAGAVVERTAQAAPQAEPSMRKVIRNGEMSFEVDRFDSAFAQVSKLTTEAGGYVGTTSSEKLPNGKVQGKVTVRVPPDRLDTLVLQLRGIGDLKSQSLEAQDVSKKYTDLESQLRAARAMEERLMMIIKEGKGQIKDLLAAEKELGNWRTKAEELTGEMKYYDNLVSMATLQLTLTERNIETAATAHESENVDAGIESEDVENARAAALKAIEEAKGRVVQSDLKRYDAGQFGATIVAEVPPDTAGALLDRLKQIGKVARLDVQRKQTADGKASTATNAPVRVEKRDTRFNLSIYNLANVAPRQTATLNLAADDVEKAYQAILDRVAKAGGRIISSNLNRQKPEQTTGTIAFEVPTAQAEAVTSDLRAAGEPMRLTVTENPDVQNVTTAKRGFNVSLIATAAVTPRETVTIQLAAADVAQAREKILTVAGAQAAHIRAAQLNENDRQNVTATLELDVKRTALPAVEKVLADAGQVIKRNVARSADAENTLDTKVRLSLTLLPADRLPPRETTTLGVELNDVEQAMASLQAAAVELGGRVVVSNLQKDREGRGIAKVAVDVPLDKSGEVVRRARELGVVRAIDASKDLQVPPGPLARARVDVTFANADTLVAPERGVFASIRRGLSTSLSGLMWSLQLIIFGVCFVLPWALVLYAIWRLVKRRRASGPAAPVPAPA